MPSVESSCPSAICLRECHRRKCTGMHCPMQDEWNMCWTPWRCPVEPVLHHYTAGHEGTFKCLSLCLRVLRACFPHWRRHTDFQTRVNQTGTRCHKTTDNCMAENETFQRESCCLSVSATSCHSATVKWRTNHAHTLQGAHLSSRRAASSESNVTPMQSSISIHRFVDIDTCFIAFIFIFVGRFRRCWKSNYCCRIFRRHWDTETPLMSPVIGQNLPVQARFF